MSFVGFLRGNTAATIKLGPYLDSTDGNSDETALTLSQADVRLSKNGGDFAQKNESSSATHDELGVYDCALNATDTNTYGRLKVITHESGALTVDQDYVVLPEIVYDSFFPSGTGAPLPIFGILDWGTAQASASGTLVHRSALNLADDIPNGSTEFVYAGTGAGQTRVLHDFTNSTDTANVAPNWTTTPSTDSLYATFATPPANTSAAPPVNVAQWNGTNVATPATAGYPAVTIKSGTGTGEINLSSGNLAGSVASVVGAVGSVTGAVGSVTGNVGGNVTGSVGSVTTVSDKTGYRLSATGVDDIHDEVVEGTSTLRQYLRGYAAALFGKASGLATTTAVYRDTGDTKARITATVDTDGNRSAVTTDLT